MMRLTIAAIAAAILSVLGATAAAASVSPPWSGPFHDLASSTLALGAPNAHPNGSQPELRSAAAHVDIAFVNNNVTSSVVELGLGSNSPASQCLTDYSATIGAPVRLEPCGGFKSQEWTWAGPATALTFRNVKTGLYLSPAAVARYARVTVSDTAHTWNQTAA